MPATTDVLVVGGGPAGAACAIALASAGHQVTVLEGRTEPSPSARGDLLAPGAVRELRELGVDPLAHVADGRSAPSAASGGAPAPAAARVDADGRSAPSAASGDAPAPAAARGDADGRGASSSPRGEHPGPTGSTGRAVAEPGSPADALAHPVLGTRMRYGERSVAVRWPRSGSDPIDGVAWRRPALDRRLRERAAAAGADVRLGALATSALVDRGFVRGAAFTGPDGEADEIACRFLLVADGASSRFGRALGTNRDRRWPYAVSTSTYVRSPRSGDSWIETDLGVHDPDGNPTTGHGWVHPLGDGTLNVGVTLLSSYRDVLGLNVVKLLDGFCRSVAGRWRFDPDERLVEPVRWRTPLGGSVAPKMGPTFLVAGDAAAMANPFNGHGVHAALATGRLAADVLDEALRVGNSTTLQRFPAQLDERVGQYHKVGRLSARFLGRPWLLRLALESGIRSDAAMGAALRIATDELRPEGGGAERAYALARLVARFAPSW